MPAAQQPPPTIRPHTPGDNPALADTLAALHGHPYPGTPAGTTPHDHLAWLESTPMTHRWVHVNPHNNKAHGHVAIGPPHPGTLHTLPPGRYLEIKRLFLHPHHTRTGAGRALLATAQDTIRATQATPVLVVANYLTPAIRLYRATGWTPNGETISNLTGDTLLIWTLHT